MDTPETPVTPEPEAEPETPCADAIRAAVEERDGKWRAWLDAAPTSARAIIDQIGAFDSWHDSRPDSPDAT